MLADARMGVFFPQDMENQTCLPYTTRILPLLPVSSRLCRCSPVACSATGNESISMYNKSTANYGRILTRETLEQSTTHLGGGDTSLDRASLVIEYVEKDNQNKGREDGRLDGVQSNHKATNLKEVYIQGCRTPTVRSDQHSQPEVKRSYLNGRNESENILKRDLSLTPTGNSLQRARPKHFSKATMSDHTASGTTRLTQVCRKLSSRSREGWTFTRSQVISGHLPLPTSATRWPLKPRTLEILVLLLALLYAATPVSGGFDRGGFQHQITWGRGNSPPGSAVFGNAPSNVTAVIGHKARLPCQVKNLGLKDVSWIRQRDLHILTVGIFTYTSDDRFKVFHPPETEDWFLDITSVTFRDTGIYECQVSTSPKVSLPIYLTVLGMQEADIPGPDEVFIQHGSTISLQCEVQAGVEAVGPVHWLKGADTLNYSSPRGGISMEVEKTPTKTMSKLYITRAMRADSGNYTCAPLFAKPDSVLVHVVNAGEESAAAVHSGSSSHSIEEESILMWGAALLPITWLFLNFSSTQP